MHSSIHNVRVGGASSGENGYQSNRSRLDSQVN